MSEGFINFSSILHAEESTDQEKGVSMRRSSGASVSFDRGELSSAKPSSPPASTSRGSRGHPFDDYQ